ncbi:MAG: aldo/keto reductase [Gammaproteobacteria bacterium]
MDPRRLGNTGLSVSPIGLGTSKLGRNTDVKYPLRFDLPSDRQLEALLQSALDLGVNLIDTAPAYGDSEDRLGNVMAGQRGHWVLCTKCGERYEDGRSTYDFSGPALLRSVDASLRRLRTDHIDILLLHSDGRDVEILAQGDTVESLHRIKTAGKARAIGISAKTSEGVTAAMPIFDVIMAPFNQRDPRLAQALGNARAQGLGILAIKGLFSGHLAAPAAIEFVLRQPFVDALIVGTIDAAHLLEAVMVAERVLPRPAPEAREHRRCRS